MQPSNDISRHFDDRKYGVFFLIVNIYIYVTRRSRRNGVKNHKYVQYACFDRMILEEAIQQYCLRVQ